MKKIFSILKSDIVLSVSWILAILSMFLVHPSKEYINYIDFNSLLILWSLMIIMQVFKESNTFEFLANKVLIKTKKMKDVYIALVFICFFSSMFVTNDVALITFVPLSVLVLKDCNNQKAIPIVVVLQTIAANLGSMMTPIGNPQNLYLFSLSNMSINSFVKFVFPYTLISGLVLFIYIVIQKGGKNKVNVSQNKDIKINNKKKVYIYVFLFIIAILTVLRIIDSVYLALVVLVFTLLLSKKSLLKVDYALLLTFVGFFIFIGNISNVKVVNEFLSSIVVGKEVLVAIISSQFVSNVPSALLLSGFTNNIKNLIIGVNFGGLGTLIASMASLISYKVIAKEMPEEKGRYFKKFTMYNIVFLIVLSLSYVLATRL